MSAITRITARTPSVRPPRWPRVAIDSDEDHRIGRVPHHPHAMPSTGAAVKGDDGRPRSRRCGGRGSAAGTPGRAHRSACSCPNPERGDARTRRGNSSRAACPCTPRAGTRGTVPEAAGARPRAASSGGGRADEVRARDADCRDEVANRGGITSPAPGPAGCHRATSRAGRRAGVKTARTPSRLRWSTSSAGMVPPPNTTMSPALLREQVDHALEQHVVRAESSDKPMAATSSWMAASTICSGLRRMPV